MRKYILLIPLFFFACKKNGDTPRITVRQQPSKIAVYDVDLATAVETLQYEIDYFYNVSASRFDSIIVAGTVYRFNYSRLNTEHKILLNYTDSLSSYGEILFDANFYSLSSYNEIPPSGSATTNTFQYDSYKRITGYAYSTFFSFNNFIQSYTYRNDSVFQHTNRPFDGCESNDTIVNSYYDMNPALPYLLFIGPLNACASIVPSSNILMALPISNYTNKLPAQKIFNSGIKSEFLYTGDSKYRLAEALVTTKFRSNDSVVSKQKMIITY